MGKNVSYWPVVSMACNLMASILMPKAFQACLKLAPAS
jgi:hypothetical protein